MRKIKRNDPTDWRGEPGTKFMEETFYIKMVPSEGKVFPINMNTIIDHKTREGTNELMKINKEQEILM